MNKLVIAQGDLMDIMDRYYFSDLSVNLRDLYFSIYEKYLELKMIVNSFEFYVVFGEFELLRDQFRNQFAAEYLENN